MIWINQLGFAAAKPASLNAIGGSHIMQVELQVPRFRSEVTPQGLPIVIPARRNWLILLFLIAWLGGWIMGEGTVSKQLLNSTDKTPVAFLSLWLVGWTIGGTLAVGAVLWQLAGREILTIDSLSLLYRVEVFGIGRSRSFRAADVKNVRSTEYAFSSFMSQRTLFPPIVGAGYGPVAFDYGARTFRIAPSLDEAEARILVGEMTSRLPNKLL
jgi:hypothetical protein